MRQDKVHAFDCCTARGAIIEAAVGGAAEAAIGGIIDAQAEDLQDKLPNARVERVGEGIHITFDSGILFDSTGDAAYDQRLSDRTGHSSVSNP